MIYLILDTNIWLYMANGFDSIANRIHIGSDSHITVFQKLKSKVENGEFKILVNEIILNEWLRNKATAFLHIKELQKEKSEKINEIVSARNQLDLEDFKAKCAVVNDYYNQEIDKNQAHIDEVEKFIQSCESIEVSDKVKLEVAELAIKKEQAPFKRDKNNCADAAILYSSIDYLSEHMQDHIEKAVFVSNNFKEFGESKDSKQFHPDLIPRLGTLSIDFHRHFTNLLELTEDLQYEIEYFHELIRDSDRFFYCMSPYCESREDIYGFGYLDENIRIVTDLNDVDPNQLLLFDSLPLPTAKKLDQVRKGACVICSSDHVECPDCDTLLIDLNGSDQYYCNDCEENYEIGKCPRNGDLIIYRIEDENVHL